MRVRGWYLALLAGALISVGARGEEPVQDAQSGNENGMPPWPPGPLAAEEQAPIEGRVPVRELGIALILPESWRADDVTWREVPADAATTLNPMAEAGFLVEFASGGSSERLLTVYRVPLKPWRSAIREGTAGPGRIAMIDGEKALVVERPEKPRRPGRLATLIEDVEGAIASMAKYDVQLEERYQLAKDGSAFAGTLGDGSPVSLQLQGNGDLTLTFGTPQRELKGRWVQRGIQVLGTLVVPGEKVSSTLLFHFDGIGLIPIQWDEKVLGKVGTRLERPK